MPLENLTRDEAAVRAAGISDVTYDIELVLSADPAAETFTSSTRLTFAAGVPDTFLDLDAARVVSLEINGRSVDTAAFADHRVRLTDLAGQNTVTVVAECRYQHTGVGLHRVLDPADGQVYLYTHFEPFDAHKVFACFDQPDLKAPVNLTVTAPSAWEVVANGAVEQREELSDNTARVRFVATRPISTYLVAVVAGPYHGEHDRHGDVDLGVYVRQSLAAHLDAAEIFEITKQGLDFYAETFGIPYPFGKYDQLFVPEFNMGAMENPGCITFNDTYIFRSKVTEAARGRRADTILHEMAHMWFGDLVTMRWWDDLWLNESFATVWAAYCKYTATRFKDAWVDFAYSEKGWAMRQDQLPSTHPVAADMVDTEAVRLNFDGITYAKGASVLRQLVAYVGYDAFVAGMRQYFAKHQWSNATFSDLLDALEQACGQDLRQWADGWLRTSGLTALSAECSTEGGRVSSLVLRQSPVAPNTTLRRHRLAVALYRVQDGRVVRDADAEVNLVDAELDVTELRGSAAPDLVMPNDGDLTFAKVRLDRRSQDTLVEFMSAVQDSLARALGWSYCWDMTRDGDMPARRYLEIVARHAGSESEATLLERLLAQAQSAIELYGDPAHRIASRQRLNRATRELLLAAHPGSDRQLVWARSFIATVDAAADLDYVRALLDGEEQLDGLIIDTDLRWQIVGRLASSGAAGADVVNAELRRDPTDIGVRRALTALTAQPLAEVKARAWQQLETGRLTPIPELNAAERFSRAGELSLQELGAIIAGFDHPAQQDLVQPYLERYTAAVPGWWRDRTPDEAEELTAGLFPTYDTGDAVVASADRLLTDSSLSPPAQRIVLEARDGALRSRRAREADIAEGAREEMGSAV